jgi:hypothetical protein
VTVPHSEAVAAKHALLTHSSSSRCSRARRSGTSSVTFESLVPTLSLTKHDGSCNAGKASDKEHTVESYIASLSAESTTSTSTQSAVNVSISSA